MNNVSSDLQGLASLLYREGALDLEAAQHASHAAKQKNIALVQHLVQSGLLSSQTIFDFCTNHFFLPIFHLKNYQLQWLQQGLISLELIEHYHVLPLESDQHRLRLGISDPANHEAIAAIQFHTGLTIQPVLVAEAELNEIIQVHCRPRVLNSQLETALSKLTLVAEQENGEEDERYGEPVTQFVDCLIQDAIKEAVSDIHLEPFSQYYRIRFRRHGLLYEAANIPLPLSNRILTRLKIMANLNIAEKRLPQDGRIKWQVNTVMDIRVSTCPTLNGEKMVLRLLNANQMNLAIDTLGMTDSQQHLFLEKLSQPQGLIIATGPTGSGKTITLYAALHYLNTIEKNIATVEDPIEIELAGTNQVNVNSRIGLDFASVLRTFLRQDPDIIMLGEIRDAETANIAIQAAQTGHLVLSTLHTNSAIETIARLKSFGVPAYHLIHSVSLIIAQRLVRFLCSHCKQVDTVSTQVLTQFKSTLIYRPNHCPRCHQGYQGRTGIFELIAMTPNMAEFIFADMSTTRMQDKAKNENWFLLWEAGLEKVKAGITSYMELERVLVMPEQQQNEIFS